MGLGDVQDGVDEAGSGACGYGSCFHAERRSDDVGLGLDVGFGEESAVVLDGDVLQLGAN